MKSWYKSKTLWFNAVYLLLLVFGAVAGFVGYEDFVPSDLIVQIGVVVVPIVNLILRKFFTNEAI